MERLLLKMQIKQARQQVIKKSIEAKHLSLNMEIGVFLNKKIFLGHIIRELDLIFFKSRLQIYKTFTFH